MATCRICNSNNLLDAQRCASCGAWLDVANEARGDSAQPASQPPASAAPQPTDPTEAQVVALMALGRKIEAIKVFRTATGAGLKEAKDAVEQIAQRYGISPGSQGGGCAALVVLLVVVALVVAGAAVAVYLAARP